jgi:hypothetical protein
MTTTYEIHVLWDDEAKVWFVIETNVPGLTTGAPTREKLLEKLQVLVPEMLEENGRSLADVKEVVVIWKGVERLNLGALAV